MVDVASRVDIANKRRQRDLSFLSVSVPQGIFLFSQYSYPRDVCFLSNTYDILYKRRQGISTYDDYVTVDKGTYCMI